MSASPRYVASSSALGRVHWRHSARSNGLNNCVETARLGAGLLAVRDSKDSAGPALLFTAGAWRCFVGGLTHTGFAPVR
ncbi:DUF397 domain-containing protein [Streptomyces sp. NPDC003077]|uniref:DUF397 domain-containing protein n=1 Tax=Streptomyces sp. NPDC003077 TaxID=3154443 RepID=UPI0033BB99D7